MYFNKKIHFLKIFLKLIDQFNILFSLNFQKIKFYFRTPVVKIFIMVTLKIRIKKCNNFFVYRFLDICLKFFE